MKYQPLGDRVFVKRSETEGKTPGGIIIPESSKEVQLTGEVLAVGPGRILEDGSFCRVNMSIGDMVMFGRYSGQEIDICGDTVLMLREDDIIARFSE